MKKYLSAVNGNVCVSAIINASETPHTEVSKVKRKKNLDSATNACKVTKWVKNITTFGRDSKNGVHAHIKSLGSVRNFKSI